MSWRDQLQPASFRGVAFHTVSDSATFGRRSVLHEFPFRDLPYVEDMGRKAREIRIVGFVLGADYLTALDSLIDAIEQPGSGKLVHPTLGELTVSISDGGVIIDQSNAEGGVARISFSCIESGEARFPSAAAATQDVLKTRAGEASLSAASGFTQRFDLDGLPGWAQRLSIDRAQGFLDQVRGAIAPLANFASGRGTVLGILDAIAPQLGDLLRDGHSFTQQVGSLLGALRGGIDAPAAMRVLGTLDTYGAGETHLPATTETRRREATNRDSLVEFLRATAAIDRAHAVAELEFDDFQQAVEVRDSVTAQIDIVADATTDDTLFDALTAVRAAVVRDVATRGADLARLVTVTPQATMPALVLAHDLYQDASRDADILMRNRIVHPGFVPAGRSLEVPADA